MAKPSKSAAVDHIPRPPLQTVPPDIPPAAGQEYVQAVVRAMGLLKAFDGNDKVFLSLTELARRTGMHKPTALRLARSLALSQFLVQRDDGAWRLGPAAGWIGSRYQAQSDVGSVIEPILRKLSMDVGESASFYLHEGSLRSCLMRCDGPNAPANHPRTGELLPLDRGAPGRAILAALGEPGDLYERIRRQGFYWSRDERGTGAAAGGACKPSSSLRNVASPASSSRRTVTSSFSRWREITTPGPPGVSMGWPRRGIMAFICRYCSFS